MVLSSGEVKLIELQLSRRRDNSPQPTSPKMAHWCVKLAGESGEAHRTLFRASVGGCGGTQAEIAERLGVARETVRDWLDMPNGESAKAHKTDNRVKVVGDARAELAERVEAGEQQEQTQGQPSSRP